MRPIQVYKTPPLHPWNCMKCRSGEGTREFFVDLGFDTEWEGTVYLCDKCMMDLGNSSLIFLTREKHLEVMREVDTELQRLHDFEDSYSEYAFAFHKTIGGDLTEFLNNLRAIVNGPRINGSVSESNDSTNTNSISAEPDDSGIATTVEPPIIPIVPTFA